MIAIWRRLSLAAVNVTVLYLRRTFFLGTLVFVVSRNRYMFLVNLWVYL